MKYITIKEAAAKWGISIRRVNVYCNTNRIEGAYRMGMMWVIPENAPKPTDLRKEKNK